MKNDDLITQIYDALFCYAKSLGCVNEDGADGGGAGDDNEKTVLVDSLDHFRTGDKLYGTPLLQTFSSPAKYWKHLSRFPTSAKLAHCASRLLSISTRSMMLVTPSTDAFVDSINKKIFNANTHNVHDLQQLSEKVLPIKSFLMSHPDNTNLGANKDVHEDDEAIDNFGSLRGGGGGEDRKRHQSNGSNLDEEDISRIITSVSSSLHQYSFVFVSPFSEHELTCLASPSAH